MEKEFDSAQGLKFLSGFLKSFMAKEII